MFIDAITKRVSKPGEKQFKVITATRQVEYTNKVTDPWTEEVRMVHSKGWEIVTEIAVTEDTYNKLVAVEGRVQ